MTIQGNDIIALVTLGVLEDASAPSTAVGRSGTEWDESMMLAADALLHEFGVGITYMRSGGDDRAIVGVVDYDTAQNMGAMPQGKGSVFTVMVKNHATEGVTPDELNTGKDKIKIPDRVGNAAIERKITQIIEQNEGFLTLEVR